MINRTFLCCLLLVVTSCNLGSLTARQSVANQEPSPLDWFPDSTAVYVQIESAEQLLDHPLRKQVLDSPIVQALWKSDQLKQPRAAIASFEFITATRLETVLRKLNAGGVHLAIDAKTQGVVILAKSESEKWLRQYLKRLILLARNDAEKKQQPDPIKEKNYLGVQGYQFQSNIFAVMGPWLLVTDKSELAKVMIESYADKLADSNKTPATSSLLNNPRFKAWQAMVSQSATTNEATKIARVYLDLDTLRSAGVAKELLGGKTNDFGGELVLGGVLAVLHQSPQALGQLSLTNSGIKLDWQVPSQTSWIGEAREFYAGPNATGEAPPLLTLPGAIGSLSTYRNLSLMWLRSGDLFNQQVNDNLAQADNTLTTLFSGKDFGEDILGAIEPQLQIVVAPQTTKTGQPLPSVQLPTFALRGTMKSPGSLQRELRRIYQNAIGFLNIVGAMEGNPQLDMQSEKDPQTQAEYYWAEYVPDSDKQYTNGLPIQFNFQPCLAFHEQSVIVSSHIDLARQIVANGQGSTADTKSTKNTQFSIDGTSLTNILRSNREQLVSNNVLEKGHSRQQAENEVDVLLDLLAMVRDFQGSLDFEPESAGLSLELNLNAAAIDPK
jgi:hypothetical protein